MSDSLSFKYTLTEEDMVRAIRAHVESKSMWLRMLVAVAVPGFFLVASAADSTAAQFSVDIAVGVVAGIIIWFAVWPIAWSNFWSIFTSHRKLLVRKSSHIGVEVEMTASPDGMAWSSPAGNTRSKWSAYTSVREKAEDFLLCAGITLSCAIPKHAFTDPKDVDRFRDLIRAHVPKVRLLDRPEK